MHQREPKNTAEMAYGITIAFVNARFPLWPAPEDSPTEHIGKDDAYIVGDFYKTIYKIIEEIEYQDTAIPEEKTKVF